MVSKSRYWARTNASRRCGAYLVAFAALALLPECGQGIESPRHDTSGDAPSVPNGPVDTENNDEDSNTPRWTPSPVPGDGGLDGGESPSLTPPADSGITAPIPGRNTDSETFKSNTPWISFEPRASSDAAHLKLLRSTLLEPYSLGGTDYALWWYALVKNTGTQAVCLPTSIGYSAKSASGEVVFKRTTNRIRAGLLCRLSESRSRLCIAPGETGVIVDGWSTPSPILPRIKSLQVELKGTIYDDIRPCTFAPIVEEERIVEDLTGAGPSSTLVVKLRAAAPIETITVSAFPMDAEGLIVSDSMSPCLELSNPPMRAGDTKECKLDGIQPRFSKYVRYVRYSQAE